MESVPGYMKNHFEHSDKDEAILRSEQEVPREELESRRNRLGGMVDQDASLLDKILLESRILIIEGISGSGKDTFQTYLTNKLKGRNVHDFSEGEVLHSWKHLQIRGIGKLRVKFMRLLMNYVRDTVNEDDSAIFLLNRFHLSTYASTITQNPKLKKIYDEIIDILKTLHVHIFILQLERGEIERRSLHPERSGAWQKFQQNIDRKAGFYARLRKQQQLMLQQAERQKIPYSIVKISYDPYIVDGQRCISEASSTIRPGLLINAADTKKDPAESASLVG